MSDDDWRELWKAVLWNLLFPLAVIALLVPIAILGEWFLNPP